MKLDTYWIDASLWERAGGFAPPEGFRLASTEKPRDGAPHAHGPSISAVEYLKDGNVMLRFPAVNGVRVHVNTGRLCVYKFSADMKDRGDGIFETIMPSDSNLRGNIVLEFLVDGVQVLHPYLPAEAGMGRLCNYIEVPDWETPYVQMKDVPHGAVSREVFWSETAQSWQRCLVYTPPGYYEGGTYPVLYLQHGGGENETCWTVNGKLPYILDNSIAEGKTVPFVVVMCDGTVKSPGQTGINDFDGIEGVICNDCRKYVEQRYRVRLDKWGRAIAGLSLGSMQAVYIGLRHPELFSAIGSFTYLRCRDKSQDYDENVHLNALKDPASFWTSYRLFFRSIGGEEAHMCEFLEDDDFLARCGIPGAAGYEREIYPGMTHNWGCWRRALYNFSQRLFRW